MGTIMTRRTIEHSVETIPDPGDEAVAAQLLGMWPDGLADQIISKAEPAGYHPAHDPPLYEGDDEVAPHGYFGYSYYFVRGKVYALIALPPRAMRAIVRDAALLQKYVDVVGRSLDKAASKNPSGPPYVDARLPEWPSDT